ncbi:hypothetical protein IF1G_08201 [Cordyceps javanica]|uniref:Uncharacterized protein n=1 Tax=Cordyceps javanica TaxID=43265 RepID=A0A545UTV6_9HYPO|nr:hypothetical protein IF1G_08201 [Cordyceps javanica]
MHLFSTLIVYIWIELSDCSIDGEFFFFFPCKKKASWPRTAPASQWTTDHPCLALTQGPARLLP